MALPGFTAEYSIANPKGNQSYKSNLSAFVPPKSIIPALVGDFCFGEPDPTTCQVCLHLDDVSGSYVYLDCTA
jgi:hypothetical protein